MGRRDGVHIGQKWLVIREGEPLYGRNGEHVGVDIIKIGEITVTRVETNTSIAKIVRVEKPKGGKAYTIERGDFVRHDDPNRADSFLGRVFSSGVR